MTILRKSAVCAGVLCCALLAAAQQEKLTAQEIVARHLDSIGMAAARAAIRSRTAQAGAQYDVLIGRPAGHAQGSALLVSLDRRVSFAMRFPGTVYPDEQYVFDGKEVKIALANTRERSAMGDFFYRHDVLMKEGLFAGTLRTSWALLDTAGRQPKLRYDGLKKIDGRELHDLVYVPTKGADPDLIIHLYFEPDTFRHVKTVYSFNVPQAMQHVREQQRGSVRSRGQDREDTRYKVEEDFSEFRPLDGVTLPGRWKLTYTGESSVTLSTAWEFTLSAVAHNNVTE